MGLVLSAGIVMGSGQQAHALLFETLTETTKAVDGTVRGVTSQVKLTSEQLEAQKRTELESRQRAIEDRINEKRAAINEKLSGARQERCESKQATINQILDNRSAAAQRHFDRFKNIQDKLVAFVAAKNLNVENASALELIMNDKQTAAQAAVTAVAGVDFVCKDADASSPGSIVMDEIIAAKQALKDYRDAIKDYAVAVRAAADVETETTEGAAQ